MYGRRLRGMSSKAPGRVLASNLSNVSVVEQMALHPQWECPSDSRCGPTLCKRPTQPCHVVCPAHAATGFEWGNSLSICQNNDFSVFWVSSWCDPVKVPLPPPPPAWYVVIGELPCLNFSISQGEIAKQHSSM